MKKYRILLMLACALYAGEARAATVGEWFQSFWSGSESALPKIKILIAHDQPSALLEVRGKYTLEDPHAQAHLSTRQVGKSQTIQAISGGLKWGEEFPGVHQIQITPKAPDTLILVNGQEYKGRVQIYNIGRTISIVNELPVEEYLAYLLPDQYSKNLPEEVLAALTITARTDAFYQAKFPRNKFWGVEAKQIGYKGATSNPGNHPVLKAIKNTQNMVMSQTGTYEKVVTPFAALWNSDGQMANKGASSQMTLSEAVEMAQEGAHAAAILSKAFPQTTIQLMR